ncbi:hypothetical protein ACIOEW_33835 [Streptomyces sp. NPDC087901]|uniref:hypothetical protein n=1 Tax=Streptomyces sp. NPDC087901 TaxID=3365818 RepID=UPI00382D5E09
MQAVSPARIPYEVRHWAAPHPGHRLPLAAHEPQAAPGRGDSAPRNADNNIGRRTGTHGAGPAQVVAVPGRHRSWLCRSGRGGGPITRVRALTFAEDAAKRLR